MPRRSDRVVKAYAFFCKAEKDQRVFTLEDICTETGWKFRTVDAYRTKKWHHLLKNVEGGFICQGICAISQDAFVRIHSQRTTLEKDILRPKYSEEIDALIDKCREGALLAVQTYNNPIINLRGYGYIVFMVIAFTALFHAIFAKENKIYWHQNSDGSPKTIDGDKQYWELSKCISNYFNDDNPPERANLELFIQLRNKIEHRNMPNFDLEISGYAQAMLSNFERLLVQNFGTYFALSQNLTLALQITEFSEQQLSAIKRIQSHFDGDIKEFIDKFCSTLSNEIIASNRFCYKVFLIPKLGNHRNSSDMTIEFIKIDPNNPEEIENYEGLVSLVKEKQIPVSDKDLMRPGKVIDEVRNRTGVDFRMHHHIYAWRLYEVRTDDYTPSGCNSKYCIFNSPFRSYLYTEAWVDFLCDKVSNPNEFEKIKMFRAKPSL